MSLPATRTRVPLMLGLAILLLSLHARGATPSFVCSKAKTWVEKTICGSEHLSDLDLELASVYARLLRVTSGPSEASLSAEQRRWWAMRAECRRQPDPPQCLQARYATRIAALRARPDYTEARPGPVELPPQAIASVGTGWSRGLSGYIKAIRACLRKAPAPVAHVGNAWADPAEEQAVAVRMSAGSGETWLCVARRNGSEVLSLRPVNAYEALPPEGPLFYPDSSSPPVSGCGQPAQVLDEHEAPAGWIGPACAAPAATPAEG